MKYGIIALDAQGEVNLSSSRYEQRLMTDYDIRTLMQQHDRMCEETSTWQTG
jgi:hypothetical protein